MNIQIKISSQLGQDLVLRSIGSDDLENLRRWKNENSAAFFHKKTITREEQKRWFAGYLANPDNYMFIIEHRSLAVGCIGFRMLEGSADVYNVILGDARYRRKGLMSSSLAVLCSYIADSHTKDIGIKVLKTNKAAHNFYSKNGFKVIGTDIDHDSMRLDRGYFGPLKIRVEHAG